MARAASRKELAEWASSLTNERITQSFDKQFTSGVIFCRIVEATNPGSLDMRKLNGRAHGESVAIANFTGDSQFEEPTGSIAAAAVVITIPIIIFVLFFQRRIVAGLTSGAVKG